MKNLTTEAELAEILGKTAEQVSALRRKHCWPHVFLGRYDRRYTPSQLEAIVDQMTRRSTRSPRTPADEQETGRTPRSRKRAG